MDRQFEPTVDVLIPVYRPDRKFARILQMLGRQTCRVNKIIVINTEKQYWNEEGYRSVEGLEVHHVTKEEFEQKNDNGKEELERQDGRQEEEDRKEDALNSNKKNETANVKRNPSHTTADSGKTVLPGADSSQRKSPKTGE